MAGRFSTSPVRGSRVNRTTIFYIVLAAILFLNIFVWTPLPQRYDEHRDNILKHVTDSKFDQMNPAGSHKFQGPSFATTKSKYAYATFLADDGKNHTEEHEDENSIPNKYFIATRILAYQILHAPETKTKHNIPLIVLVSPGISEKKRDRLRRDGCIVWEAPPIESDWVTTDVSTWQQVMAKLHLLELTQFERVAFLDGDTVLLKPLDGVFNDTAVQTQTTLKNATQIKDDEAQMPDTYAFSAMVEMNHKHSYPPTDANHDFPNVDYLNAGFFIVKPSKPLLNYYLSLMTLKDRFDPHLPEQNLLNYAHRRDGNMPWKMVDTKWNIHYPSQDDVKGGVHSLHDKWWSPEHAELKPLLASWRWRMQGFYEAKDAARVI